MRTTQSISWSSTSGWHSQAQYLLDTKPVAVVGYKRSKRNSDLTGSANYGKCARCNLNCFDYKLVTLTTLSGIPVVYDLVPGNLDEHLAAEAIIDYLDWCDVFADKGFIGLEWQTQIIDQTNNLIWTSTAFQPISYKHSVPGSVVKQYP